ncbi:hypothetical protein [Streptomyces sp. H27-H5]|nr:hypothetical protein [Streptomyces sp. H27-H5]MCY0957941.1 hypothetical protein [Streptomyces sp. H27-H5]
MGDRTRVKHCKQCRRPLDQRSRWRRPKRFCSRRHRLGYWVEEILDAVLN